MRVFKTEDLMEKGNHIHIFFSAAPSEVVHTHDFIELIYICSGTAVQAVNGQSFSVTHGDLIFLNYGSTHAFEAKEQFSYINLCFSPETVGNAVITPDNAFSLLSLTVFDEMRNDADGGKISFFGEERKEVEQLLFAMLREYREKASSWHTVLENYLHILMTHMLLKSELEVRQEGADGLWQELSNFIDENLQADLTLSALASRCFYNPSYFSRAFKERFSVSPLEYVTRKRLDAAMTLLRDSGLSVDEIAVQAGFSDRSKLYYAFSKYIGSTPGHIGRVPKK